MIWFCLVGNCKPKFIYIFSFRWVIVPRFDARRENIIQYNTTLRTYPCGTVSLLEKYLIDDSWSVCYGYWLDQQFTATRNLIHVNTTTCPITVVVLILIVRFKIFNLVPYIFLKKSFVWLKKTKKKHHNLQFNETLYLKFER